MPILESGMRWEFPIAEGGRSCERSRCRGEASGRPVIARGSRDCEPGTERRSLIAPPFAGRLKEPFLDVLSVRPCVSLPPSIVRTRMLEAPSAGVVRANTARFCTAADGLAMCDPMFLSPSELCCVGLRPTEFVTLAPRKDASVTWKAPRLIIWPRTKVL